ncbi:hypothetical protein Daus18300_013817 [Diaporthe australafricana]|uniref:CCHC-type domain-containing protein n=1 Tax=Diaporthe australafricana TaxID=127596 RepID=A0ABR3VXY5_9PEZI
MSRYFSGNCYNCGGFGHKAAVCPTVWEGRANAHAPPAFLQQQQQQRQQQQIPLPALYQQPGQLQQGPAPAPGLLEETVHGAAIFEAYPAHNTADDILALEEVYKKTGLPVTAYFLSPEVYREMKQSPCPDQLLDYVKAHGRQVDVTPGRAAIVESSRAHLSAQPERRNSFPWGSSRPLHE